MDCLVIPHEGLMHLFVADGEIPDSDIEKYLRMHDDGLYAMINTEGHPYLIGLLLREGAPINERAQATFLHLFGLHMLFTGPVAFSGLNHDESSSIMRRLS